MQMGVTHGESYGIPSQLFLDLLSTLCLGHWVSANKASNSSFSAAVG